ncbi:ubiquitin [Perkinsela sp. CCAP 1560/4]|nr:ubiquitin [Perkinsela sp. CCAP 1560/4]|eukprot:KNH08336.1 ubiquitin [Perkinsela sp. CCAP 1560/4]
MTASVQKFSWENNLPVVDNLLGAGGKKKKKKQLGGGAKKKHVHKNVRMAVLKYFRIDGEGEHATVTRTRTECPECGAGVFMAKHFDRESCGKCGLSIRRK